jgi:hypothetical protein
MCYVASFNNSPCTCMHMCMSCVSVRVRVLVCAIVLQYGTFATEWCHPPSSLFTISLSPSPGPPSQSLSLSLSQYMSWRSVTNSGGCDVIGSPISSPLTLRIPIQSSQHIMCACVHGVPYSTRCGDDLYLMLLR